jgi:hypothetical protein
MAALGSAATPQRPSATVDRPSDSSPKRHRRTYAVASFNPALTALGKTSGRFELAPLSAHAVFGEASRLALYVDDIDRAVSGTEVDLGYHLFPQGRGVYGLYLGPRYMFGSGEIPEAQWEFTGWGADLGYQFVVANHVVLNLGAGIARVDGSVTLDDEMLDGLPADQARGLGSLSTQSKSFWIPLVTVGLGIAI